MGVIVAIDGPAGAGKSSVARAVARELGYGRVDTGALYRAITLVAVEQGIRSAEGLAELAQRIELRFDGDATYIGQRDVSEKIRGADVTAEVSRVSAVPEVRSALLERQRELGRAHPKGSVLEGRDIGTVVFPDAEVKVFLTASEQERARRRQAELGPTTNLDEVLAAIQHRDRLDQSRAVAPLRPAEGAVWVDTTGKGFDEVVGEVVAVVRGSVEGSLRLSDE